MKMKAPLLLLLLIATLMILILIATVLLVVGIGALINRGGGDHDQFSIENMSSPAPSVIITPAAAGSSSSSSSTVTMRGWPPLTLLLPPRYDHVVIVVFENHGYDKIIGNKIEAPYINSVLLPQAANMTASFALEHDSYGNYLWLFSGSNQNAGFTNIQPSSLFSTSNLALQLIKKNKTFKGFAENLPAIDSRKWVQYPYAQKHVPWANFSNLPPRTSLRYPEDFPSDDDYTKLPTVSFVIPNMYNIMHDRKPPNPGGPGGGGGGGGGVSSSSSSKITTGDAWLSANLDSYLKWAQTHNSLLIVTFDEEERIDNHGFGLTDPGNRNPRLRNRIATLLAGEHIQPGDYPEGKGITHVTILRTLEAMYELPKSGAQQEHALRFGITDDYIITDCFTTTTATASSSSASISL